MADHSDSIPAQFKGVVKQEAKDEDDVVVKEAVGDLGSYFCEDELVEVSGRKRHGPAEPSEIVDSCDLDAVAKRVFEGDLLVFKDIGKNKQKRDHVLCQIIYRTPEIWERDIFTVKELNCPECYRIVKSGVSEFVAADARLDAASYQTISTSVLTLCPDVPASAWNQVQLEVAQFFQRALDKAEAQLDRCTELAAKKLQLLEASNMVMFDSCRTSSMPLANNASTCIRGVAIASSLMTPYERLAAAARVMNSHMSESVPFVDEHGIKLSLKDSFRELLQFFDATAKEVYASSNNDVSKLMPLDTSSEPVVRLLDQLVKGDATAISRLQDKRVEAAIMGELAVDMLDSSLWKRTELLQAFNRKDPAKLAFFMIVRHGMRQYFAATADPDNLRATEDTILRAILVAASVDESMREHCRREVRIFYARYMSQSRQVLRCFMDKAKCDDDNAVNEMIGSPPLGCGAEQQQQLYCQKASMAAGPIGPSQLPAPQQAAYTDFDPPCATTVHHRGTPTRDASVPTAHVRPLRAPGVLPMPQIVATAPSPMQVAPQQQHVAMEHPPNAQPTQVVHAQNPIPNAPRAQPAPLALAPNYRQTTQAAYARDQVARQRQPFAVAHRTSCPPLTHDELMDIFLRS